MTERDWYAPGAALGMYLSGRDIPGRDERGRQVTDDSFLALLHTGDRPVAWVLPGAPWAEGYEVVLDTSREDQSTAPLTRHRGGETVTVGPVDRAAQGGRLSRGPGVRTDLVLQFALR